MAHLRLEWALLHNSNNCLTSFWIVRTALFGLYDDGPSRQAADACTKLYKLCKHGTRTRANDFSKASFVPS